MAPVNPAYVMQGRTDHSAQLFRMAMAGIATRSITPGTTQSGSGGVNRYIGNQLNVTGLASMNVSVDTGLGYVPSATAWNGMYAGFNTASYNVAVPASSSTQWRQDYIAMVITDPGDNTAAWDIVDVPGAFSSSAPGSLPTLPNNSIPLATIAVVPNMTVTNGAGTVNDARGWMPLAGVYTTTSASPPPTARPEGTLWVETDTHLFGVILNSTRNYVVTGPTAPDTWHTMSMSNGWAITGSGTVNPKYRKLPHLNAVWVIGNIAGNAATSNNFFTLPAGYIPAESQMIAVGYDNASQADNCFLQVDSDGKMRMVNWNNALTTHFSFNGLISLDA